MVVKNKGGTKMMNEIASDVRKLERENRELKEVIAERSTKPKACEFCKFYIQHYIKQNGRYIETNAGHCFHGRTKDRRPADSCKYFELGRRETERYV